MRVLLLGSSGLLGSYFTTLLQKKGIDFLAPTSKELDLRQPEEIEIYLSHNHFTHIINCAAYTNVDQAEEEASQAHLLNAKAPYLLAKAAQQSKIIHFSTDYVFDGRSSLPYKEEDTTSAINTYGESKLMGEKALLGASNNVLIIRTSWLFGGQKKNFVRTMLALLKERESISVVSDQIGRPTYAKDLAHATFSLIDKSGVYHLCNRGFCSWYEFAKVIYDKAQERGFPLLCQAIHPISSKSYRGPAKRPVYSLLALDKYEQCAPLMPLWQAALEEYIEELCNSKENQPIS